MKLVIFDWAIIVAFLAVSLIIGFVVSKRSGKNTTEYFLSGRSMPWWMLGMSMVATTFSTDTPNLVTDLVRQNGVANNWQWWVFLITGMLTVFIYAKLWRRSKVLTDMEFYEIRYSGKAAAFLRGFRALYLGIAFNVLAMAGVTLAAIKIGEIMLDLEPIWTVTIAGLVTVIFSAMGGFRGVILTDCILFVTAIFGSFVAAWFAIYHPAVGGLDNLVSHPNVVGKLQMLPSLDDKEMMITLLIIPIAVQWWSVWYPGSEPGGGGYIAQRMLAAKNEKHAIGATFFFNLAHYALRPWPWILVALASLIVYPDLASIKEAFPGVSESKIGHDLGYSAMLTHVPAGWLGLIMASLIAAYMSTISTHLNWGASYVVNDFYQRFISKNAGDKELVWVSRLTTVGLMVVAALIALAATNATQMFKIIIMFGAGTGLLFLLRWFWWRINAWAEVAAMVGSGVISLVFFFLRSVENQRVLEALGSGVISSAAEAREQLIFGWATYWDLPISVGLTTLVWLIVMYATRPTHDDKLISFYQLIKPAGSGWKTVINKAKDKGIVLEKSKEGSSISYGILCTVLGTLLVYSTLFGTGYAIYESYIKSCLLFAIAIGCCFLIYLFWPNIAYSDDTKDDHPDDTMPGSERI